MVSPQLINSIGCITHFYHTMARYYSFDCEAFNVIFNYISAIFTTPGFTSDYFNQIVDEDDELNEDLENIPFAVKEGITIINTNYTYCNKCKLPKPQRAHHCSICNKCVLKMDHHCPWINNCVGHQNHRYFLLFLIYMTVGFTYASIISLVVYRHSTS